MADLPRISIVTSSYNQAQFIARTIESVIAQDYPHVEHIVVDGMSSDGTADVLARYPHLRIIREPDRGQADAINKGFKAATGDIFGFLNSDDTLEPGALGHVASAIDAKAGRHVVMGRCSFIDEDDRFVGIEHPSAFESHRRVLEIWKGYCLPQPAIFWTRAVWEQCGPLRVDEPLLLDYDLFCRFSARYAFHRIEPLLANYRLHTQSKTSSVTDEQRLEQAIAVSRRYWGSPLTLQYWQILASYAAFRANRRFRGARLMRAGRDQLRAGQHLTGIGKIAAGASIAPDIAAGAMRIPVVTRLVSRLRDGRKPRPLLPHTEAWLRFTSLHEDGWAGPTLVRALNVERTPAVLTMAGTTSPDRLRGRLELEALVDGRSLGRRAIQGTDFSVTWDVPAIPAGQHELRLIATTFLVPHDQFGNQDYRPLSYHVKNLEVKT